MSACTGLTIFRAFGRVNELKVPGLTYRGLGKLSCLFFRMIFERKEKSEWDKTCMVIFKE